MLRETHGSGRKEIHYPLQIFFEGDLRAVESLRRGRLLIPEHITPDSRISSVGDDQGFPSFEEEIEAVRSRGMVPGFKV